MGLMVADIWSARLQMEGSVVWMRNGTIDLDLHCRPIEPMLPRALLPSRGDEAMISAENQALELGQTQGSNG